MQSLIIMNSLSFSVFHNTMYSYMKMAKLNLFIVIRDCMHICYIKLDSSHKLKYKMSWQSQLRTLQLELCFYYISVLYLAHIVTACMSDLQLYSYAHPHGHALKYHYFFHFHVYLLILLYWMHSILQLCWFLHRIIVNNSICSDST